jgi:hypothetical protein
VNAACFALTGIPARRSPSFVPGNNLLLEELSQAEFIERITERQGVGQTLIRRKDGTSLSVFYMVIPSEVSQMPCYIGQVWPQDALART